jgi:DNA-binding CsgD family transcriptional regulator
MGEPWPLVGRHDEIELLLAALRRTDRGAMVLAGAAGVGKSRLAAEAAAAHQNAGRLGRARSARTRAHLLLTGCEGARTAALAALAGHEALTAREHQVALLASGGMASADIARQLRLSVRTVNNQLQTVFSKLDVHSRRELAGAMAPIPEGLRPRPG